MFYYDLALGDFEPTASEIEKDYLELLQNGITVTDYQVIEDDDYWYY